MSIFCPGLISMASTSRMRITSPAMLMLCSSTLFARGVVADTSLSAAFVLFSSSRYTAAVGAAVGVGVAKGCPMTMPCKLKSCALAGVQETSTTTKAARNLLRLDMITMASRGKRDEKLGELLGGAVARIDCRARRRTELSRKADTHGHVRIRRRRGDHADRGPEADGNVRAAGADRHPVGRR